MEIDLAEARRHIALLTGDSEAIRAFQVVNPRDAHGNPSDQPSPPNPIHVGTIGERAAALIAFNKPLLRCNIYVQIAGTFLLPGYFTSGRSDVTARGPVFVVIADDDGVSEAAPRLAIAIPPSAILQTSQDERRRHYYWRIHPVTVTEWMAATVHMARALDTDESIGMRAAQVMRLAGSWNWKHKHPFQAHFIEYHPERIYDLVGLLAAHPIPPDALERRAARKAGRGATPTAAVGVLSSSSLPELTLPASGGAGLPPITLPGTSPPPTPRGNGASQFTGVALERITQIETALQRDHIAYRTASETLSRPGRWFLLKHCLFNPAHIDTQAIAVAHNGALWAGCFHESACGGNRNVWSSIEKILRVPMAPTPTFQRADHPELARRALLDLRMGAPEEIVYDEGAFHRFSAIAGLWEPVPDPEIECAVAGYSGAQIIRGQRTRDVELTSGDIKGSIRVAQSLASSAKFFGDAPSGVAFRNGFLRLCEDGSVALETLTKDHRARTQLPYEYDPEARAARWLRFLHECFQGDHDVEERIAFLQEFVGACLVGEATRYQKVTLFTGEGSNGKGKFCSIIEQLFPRDRVSHVKPQDLGQPYDRAALVGVLLNLVAEIPEADILAAASFKEIVTGDTVNARNPHERVISFRPIAGHIYSANSLPGTVDYSYAFFRRFVVIQWLRRFEGAEADAFLGEKIAPDLPAIAAWALEGAQRLRKRGAYAPPPSSAEALDRWRHDVDAVSHFLRACCERTSTGDGTPIATFNGALKLWLQANSYRPINSHNVEKRLGRLGILPEGDAESLRYPVRIVRAPPTIVWN